MLEIGPNLTNAIVACAVAFAIVGFFWSMR